MSFHCLCLVLTNNLVDWFVLVKFILQEVLPKRKVAGLVPSPRFDRTRFLSLPKEEFYNSFL